MFQGFWRVVMITLMGLTSSSAFSNQCDCQQVVGRCTGAVEVSRSFGSAPSYGAEVAVYSSEKVCSKVEFIVGATPYQTLLVNRTKEAESVFGTSPITSENVRYSSCVVCKNTQASGSARPDQTVALSPPISGTWTGFTTSMFGKQDAGLILVAAGTTISGHFVHPKLGNLVLYDVAFTNGTLSGKCNTNDGPMQISLQLLNDTLQGTWSSGMWNGSVQLSKR